VPTRHASRPVRPSIAISSPSDHRLITVGPDATTPATRAGQRRSDQRAVFTLFASTGESARTCRLPAYTRNRPSTMSGAMFVRPVTPGPLLTGSG
jgi:hypothetical protein